MSYADVPINHTLTQYYRLSAAVSNCKLAQLVRSSGTLRLSRNSIVIPVPTTFQLRIDELIWIFDNIVRYLVYLSHLFILHDSFVEVFKNLARYTSENISDLNYVELL